MPATRARPHPPTRPRPRKTPPWLTPVCAPGGMRTAASESAHGFMCEAHYMLAMSLQNTLLHTSYMVDDAMKHFEKSMSDACRPAGLTDTQWLCKKSDTCAHMAFVYRCAHAQAHAARWQCGIGAQASAGVRAPCERSLARPCALDPLPPPVQSRPFASSGTHCNNCTFATPEHPKT